MTTSRIDLAVPALASSPAPPLPNGNYFPALDGLRAVAFLMVFATHYLQMPWGWTGVNVFFVLSGFLITGILFDTRDHPHRVHNFYLRRTLRIFPLYYGVMLAILLLYPVFRWRWSWAWLIWPAYLGNLARYLPPRAPWSLLEYAQPLSRTFPGVQLSLGHFWSLCVEEQFYLVWPWVVFWVRGRRKLLWICAAGLVGLPLLRALANHMLPKEVIDNAVLITATPLPFDALLLGGFVALLRRGPWAGRVLPCARACFGGLSVALLFWLVTHPAARHLSDPYVYPASTFTWGLSVIDALCACVLVMALEPGSVTFRLLNRRPLRWLGGISYGAYVFHDIFHLQFLRLAQQYTGHWRLPTAALGMVFTLLLAWASFRWFETPFIRLKDRWTLRAEAVRQTQQEAEEELVAGLV